MSCHSAVSGTHTHTLTPRDRAKRYDITSSSQKYPIRIGLQLRGMRDLPVLSFFKSWRISHRARFVAFPAVTDREVPQPIGEIRGIRGIGILHGSLLTPPLGPTCYFWPSYLSRGSR